MSLLALHDVSLARGGRDVLSGISLPIAAGRLAVLIGPNGAGKSSLLTVAAGLLPPDAGAVWLDGRPLGQWRRSALAMRRAYLPQNPRVDWPIAVEHLVGLGLVAGSAAESAAAVARALAETALVPLRGRAATALSGGELARAMLARAIVGDPALLLVDEPTAGLDPAHAFAAMALLQGRARRGAGVVAAIHDLELAQLVADDVVALRDGRLLAHGPIGEVLDEALLERLFDVPFAAHQHDGVRLFRLDRRALTSAGPARISPL